MTKIMPCHEIFSGCPFIARGKDDDEVLRCVAEHAREVHGMTKPPQEFMYKARAAIRAEMCE